MKKLILLIILLVLIGKISQAQNRASCILGDTLRLTINNYRGLVSWQESIDNQYWTAISGSSALLKYVPNTNIKWVRAMIQEDNCPAYYELPFMVNAIDTNASGYQRTNFSLEQIPADFVSENGSGFVLFDLTESEFLLHAGDWLAGFNGQLTMKQIDAVIIQDGIAKVYTSSSTVSVYDIPLNFGNPITGRVMGRVLDENEHPIVFAQVKIGSQTRLTDINGVFLFEAAEMFENWGYATAEIGRYFHGSRTFVPNPNGNVVEIRLLKPNLAGYFNASLGGTVSNENVSVQFPANAMLLNGVPYTSYVNVFVNYINPDSSNFYKEMPGNLIGNKYGNVRGLTSFGMLGIEMKTLSGEELEIAPGQLATISFPLSTEMLQTAPDTIDLWSFNETQGIWINEGEALKIGNTYVAQLPHFSFWNCDRPWEAVYLHGSILDENGNPLSGVTVNVSNPIIGGANDVSNSVGEFGGLVPANMDLIINLNYTCDGNNYNLLTNHLVGPYNQDTVELLNNIQLPNLNTIVGIIHDCNNQPITNGYILSGYDVTYLVNGNFNLISCLTEDSIRIVKNSPYLEFSSWQSYSLNAGLNDLGIITFCQGDTIMLDTVSDVEGNIYNTVLIGEQWWMAENLKTDHYSDGSIIPDFNSGWGGVTEGRYTNWLFDQNYKRAYGNEYNWYAVSDPRNVCPIGWHVPTDTEFTTLSNFLGGTNVAGGKMKTFDQYLMPNTGATNISGFSALPAGYFQTSGVNWSWLTYQAYFWTATENNTTHSWFYQLNHSNAILNRAYLDKHDGMSVRCIKN